MVSLNRPESESYLQSSLDRYLGNKLRIFVNVFFNLLVFSCGSSVSLASIFKPIAHLGWCQTRSLSQFTFFTRVGIWILQVPLPKKTPGPLFETVCLLFPIPNCPRHGELFAHPVFVYWTQRSTSKLFGLLIMSLEPQSLQLHVGVFGMVFA
jgi:hypothetical protein